MGPPKPGSLHPPPRGANRPVGGGWIPGVPIGGSRRAIDAPTELAVTGQMSLVLLGVDVRSSRGGHGRAAMGCGTHQRVDERIHQAGSIRGTLGSRDRRLDGLFGDAQHPPAVHPRRRDLLSSARPPTMPPVMRACPIGANSHQSGGHTPPNGAKNHRSCDGWRGGQICTNAWRL